MIAGIGILNKHSMLLFGGALILGLLASSGLRYFRNPWIWLGAINRVHILCAKSSVGDSQSSSDFGNAPQRAHCQECAYVALVRIHRATGAADSSARGAACSWPGYGSSSRRRRESPYRFLGWTYVFLLLEMLVLKARIYYLAPVYPVFFAAGAVWIESEDC